MVTIYTSPAVGACRGIAPFGAFSGDVGLNTSQSSFAMATTQGGIIALSWVGPQSIVAYAAEGDSHGIGSGGGGIGFSGGPSGLGGSGDGSGGFAATEARLVRLGFEKQVDELPIYQRGPFAIEVNEDGTCSLFSDTRFKVPVRWIYMGKGSRVFGATSIMRKGDTRDDIWNKVYLMQHAAYVRSSEPTDEIVDELMAQSVEEQLIETGFEKLHEGIYRKEETSNVWNEYGRDCITRTLIALVEDGAVSRLFTSFNNRAWVSETFLYPIEYTERPLAYDDDKWNGAVLRITDGLVEYDVSWWSAGGLSGRLLREATPEELGVKSVEVVEEESGFKIGGVNSTELIRKLASLNKIPIETLEKRMRPWRPPEHESVMPYDLQREFCRRGWDSVLGYLRADQGLLDVLAEDNDFVLSRGLTHQELAKHLKFMCAVVWHKLGSRASMYVGYESTIDYMGRKFEVYGNPNNSDIPKPSPFQDTASEVSDITVTNLSNGKKISFAGLLPHMIEGYGFYEGKGTHYRLEPADVIEVFDFLKQKKSG